MSSRELKSILWRLLSARFQPKHFLLTLGTQTSYLRHPNVRSAPSLPGVLGVWVAKTHFCLSVNKVLLVEPLLLRAICGFPTPGRRSCVDVGGINIEPGRSHVLCSFPLWVENPLMVDVVAPPKHKPKGPSWPKAQLSMH